MGKNDVFNSVPIPKVKKSKFDLSHAVRTTGKMGPLIPVLCEDVVPGESWRWRGNVMLRVAPMLAPIMSRVRVTLHAFFVASRTLNTGWKDYIYGGEDGLTTETRQQFRADTVLVAAHALGQTAFEARFGISSLWDYLGLPPVDWNASSAVYVAQTRIVAEPFLAYAQIWQYYYKDQNVDADDVMQAAIAGGTINTTDFLNDYSILRYRSWAKDVWTSALPWPQRGADVLLPVEGVADGTDIVYDNVSTVFSGVDQDPLGNLRVTAAQAVQTSVAPGGTENARIENIESITFANNTITINDFRTAVVLQKWLEINARGGSRYNEGTLMHYGQTVPDYRIDQPEYIGGGVQNVNFSEVVSTAWSNDGAADLPLGELGGFGMSLGASSQFTYRCPEHGWIMVLASVLPDADYMQGLPKKFTKIDRFDILTPEFGHLGEQAILKQELYWKATDDGTVNEDTFGYQRQYYEYVSLSNRISGQFRSLFKFWTLVRDFDEEPSAGAPALDTDFIYASVSDRIFAVQDGSDYLWMQVYHEISALRPIPYYSVPGISKI